jgi:signal peptidase I
MIIKERKPIAAAILSLIVSGLGQVYNGQLTKGIVFFSLACIWSLLPLTGIQYHFYGWISLLAIGILIGLFIAGDAFFSARRLKEIHLRSFNKWYYYLLIIALVVSTDILTRDFSKKNIRGTKAYRISSATMMPTLIPGERVMVNLKSYVSKGPAKGDIVIFQNPEKPSSDIAKRVAATENDIIESRDKIIYLNGKVLIEPYVQHDDENVKNDQRDNFGPMTVPKGKVFVMGDHRDQSYDSRYLGYVDVNQIKGKVIYIYWSNEMHRIGKAID